MRENAPSQKEAAAIVHLSEGRVSQLWQDELYCEKFDKVWKRNGRQRRRQRSKRVGEHINNADPAVSLKAIDLDARLDGEIGSGVSVVTTVNTGQESEQLHDRLPRWRAGRGLTPDKLFSGNGKNKGNGNG